jgi:hypothetical protein
LKSDIVYNPEAHIVGRLAEATSRTERRVNDSPFPLGGNDLRLEFVAIGGGRVH